jgi:hypothetical protein
MFEPALFGPVIWIFTVPPRAGGNVVPANDVRRVLLRRRVSNPRPGG